MRRQYQVSDLSCCGWEDRYVVLREAVAQFLRECDQAGATESARRLRELLREAAATAIKGKP